MTVNTNPSTHPSSLLDMLQASMPVRSSSFDISGLRAGLVIVDEVNGFCTVGAGPLAPPVPNAQIATMVAETVSLARRFQAAGQPIAAFLDTHEPGKAEPPYPPHCEIGSGQEKLVPDLEWLETENAATLIPKDCINGFIGAIDTETGRNRIADWIIDNQLQAVILAGICTDICVMDFGLTLLSARNHGMLGDLRDVVVLDSACSTYDLPIDVARAIGLPDTAAHPQDATHHLGLYFLASRGAVIASSIV